MLDDGEVLRTPVTQRRPSRCGVSTEKPARRPAFWNAHDAVQFEEGTFGAYPVGFLPWALSMMGLSSCRHEDLLHVCSGGLGPDTKGVRVDIRPTMRPDVVADGTALPFADGVFRGVMLDPPYSVEYAEHLYGTGYPKPSHLLGEAARVVRPGGAIGMLHFLIPQPPKGATLAGIYGVTQGSGYRIRAFTVFRMPQASLFLNALP